MPPSSIAGRRGERVVAALAEEANPSHVLDGAPVAALVGLERRVMVQMETLVAQVSLLATATRLREVRSIRERSPTDRGNATRDQAGTEAADELAPSGTIATGRGTAAVALADPRMTWAATTGDDRAASGLRADRPGTAAHDDG